MSFVSDVFRFLFEHESPTSSSSKCSKKGMSSRGRSSYERQSYVSCDTSDGTGSLVFCDTNLERRTERCQKFHLFLGITYGCYAGAVVTLALSPNDVVRRNATFDTLTWCGVVGVLMALASIALALKNAVVVPKFEHELSLEICERQLRWHDQAWKAMLSLAIVQTMQYLFVFLCYHFRANGLLVHECLFYQECVGSPRLVWHTDLVCGPNTGIPCDEFLHGGEEIFPSRLSYPHVAGPVINRRIESSRMEPHVVALENRWWLVAMTGAYALSLLCTAAVVYQWHHSTTSPPKTTGWTIKRLMLCIAAFQSSMIGLNVMCMAEFQMRFFYRLLFPIGFGLATVIVVLIQYANLRSGRTGPTRYHARRALQKAAVLSIFITYSYGLSIVFFLMDQANLSVSMLQAVGKAQTVLMGLLHMVLSAGLLVQVVVHVKLERDWKVQLSSVEQNNSYGTNAPLLRQRDGRGPNNAHCPRAQNNTSLDASTRAGNTTTRSTEIAEETACVVCFEQAQNCLLRDCNHLCVCYECASMLMRTASPKCPMCRSDIQDILRVFAAGGG